MITHFIPGQLYRFIGHKSRLVDEMRLVGDDKPHRCTYATGYNARFGHMRTTWSWSFQDFEHVLEELFS